MTASAAKPPRYGLDTVLPLRPAQNYFRLAGWAFVPGAGQPSRVRIVVNGRAHAPAETTERADVVAAFPDEPHAARSGFKFVVYLPFGLHLGTLEVSADGETWQRLRPLVIPVSSHPILGAVQIPPGKAPVTKPVRIQGWCFHPEFKVKAVVLQFGNVEVPCTHGVPRPDVAARFPDHPAAAGSGFITDENLPRGSGRVKIRVLTECGRVYFVPSELEIAIEQGFIPKPPPPSPSRDLSTLAISHAVAPPLPRDAAAKRIPAGERNILFVLYGDFSANSALHVASLANELIALGYDCVVAVPAHKETLGALPRADFVALNFDELPSLPAYFKDGCGPRLVHAWTSRENVREFSQAVAARHGSTVLVHLEDNEQEILESRLGRPYAELAALPDIELDALVPSVLSHPHRAAAFLRSAAGVTVIVDRLRDHVPAGRPCQVIWPAADARNFFPQPRDEQLRARLGFGPRDIVLFYHGNTHTSNSAEMHSLYEAVALLNQRGRPTQLLRAGRDFPDFLPEGDAWILPYLVHLGHVRPRFLPPLMTVADYFVQPGLPGAFNDYRFPSKLPEFFALGRPVILPRSNLGNLVRHGEDAWVLAQADATGIADAIATIHDDPALRERLARGAVAFARENFSWPRSARRLLEFYRSLTTLPAPASS